MRTRRIFFMIGLTIFVINSITLFAQQNEERRPPREKWSLATIQATVEAIDLEKREVILKGPAGNLVTIEVDESVERLNEVKVGDLVSADYWTYMKAEFRDPTPDEIKEPLVVLVEAGKAPAGMDPSAVVGAVVKAVVTIEMINRPAMEVTIKGPRGKYVTMPVADKALLEQLKVGEVGVLTYAEALALSLEKIEKK